MSESEASKTIGDLQKDQSCWISMAVIHQYQIGGLRYLFIDPTWTAYPTEDAIHPIKLWRDDNGNFRAEAKSHQIIQTEPGLPPKGYLPLMTFANPS
jgi:hypothetical protein